MGHRRKEHIARLGILPRHLQRPLRQLQMLQLLKLFGIHLAEEKDGLIGAQELVPH